VPAPKDLLDRVRQRLDESSVGISQEVMDLPAPDVADLINQLTLVEAATVLAMLPIAHAIEVCDQPTMRRRGAILERLDPERAAQILESITVLAVCAWSTTIGSLIPMAAHRFRIDPAVLSAPLITTLVDATGLVIYFTIAKVILHL
jgi:Mg/Co/Ni transporter MgtE